MHLWRRDAHALRAAFIVLMLSVALARPARASEDTANANAEVAGERAHFAEAFCGTSPARISLFKERIKAKLSEATDFDHRWQTGWKRGEDNAHQMSALRLSNPEEFASQVKGDCNRLKWVVQNSMRKHPEK